MTNHPDWVNDAARRRAEREARFRRRRASAMFLGMALVVLLASLSAAGGSHATKRPRIATDPLAALHEPLYIREHRREQRAIERVRSYTPFVLQGGNTAREIALTFDDGPGPFSQGLLNVLEQYHVPATFFVVGAMERYFGAVTTAQLQGGYDIEDHTVTHPSLPQLSAADQRFQIVTQTQDIARAGAPFPHLFRPPYGSFNSRTLAELRRQQMLMVLWSTDTEDYKQPGVPAIVHAALAGARPGAIVLMHDAGGPRSQTIAALPAIIRELRARRYTLVTVPRLLLDDPPPRGQALPPGLNGG